MAGGTCLLGDLVELKAELGKVDHLVRAGLEGNLTVDGLGMDANDLTVGKALKFEAKPYSFSVIKIKL